MPGDRHATQNNAVALKLPTFWDHQPRVWFPQAEAQFTLQVVTVDSTKYSYLVATLPEDVTTRALDSTDKYKGLKDELLGTFTQTAYCDFV